MFSPSANSLKPTLASPLNRMAILGLFLLASFWSSGCVSRRMTIRSNPPGALVEVDGKRIGLTPVSMDFDYYGTHEISLSAPGYETMRVHQPVEAPLGQRIPIDFFTNHFLFGHVTDRHDFTYNLARRREPIDEELNLIDRGRNFRSQAQIGGVAQP
ncbi:PEGA domain-containing protein [Thalassoglobus sp. JC818]|uniref:PEGA domain-containing protein n=1 Tax=Thalassoglobus sp. JC818 TaxID=3232136 RepID=UPI00345802C1